MIGYVTLGTNDLARAIGFYDTLLAELGTKQMWATDRRAIWGTPATPCLMVTKPFDNQPANPGNGTMVALLAPSTEMVGKVYMKALSLGAKDEGAPGYRGDEAQSPRFYGAYFRDLDGNKITVFRMVSKQNSVA